VATSAELAVLLTLQDQASGPAKAAGLSFDGLKAAAMAAGAAATSMAGFLSDVSREAAADAAAMEAVRVAVENSGGSWGDAEGEISAFIDSMRDSAAIADDKMKPVLASLVASTKDYGKALDLASLAADIARGKNMSLEAAADLVGKVAMGNTGILKRYGITLDDNATSQEALAELQERFAGQAEAYGQTTQGQLEATSLRIGDFRESLGGALGAMQPVFAMLPGLSTAWSGLGALIGGATPKLIAQTVATIAHAVASGAMTVATLAMTVAQGALNAVMSANPLMLVVIALAAVAAAIIYLYNNSEDFRNLVDKLLQILGDAVGGVLAAFGAAIQGIGDILGAVGGAIGAFAGGVGEAIGAAGGAIGSFPGTVGSAFSAAGEAVGTFAGNFGSTLSGLPGMIPNLLDAGTGMVNGLWQGMQSAWSGLEWNIRSLFEGIKNLVPDLWEAGEKLIKSIWLGLERAWNDMISWFRQKWEDLRGILPFSEPKDPTSPLRGLSKSGESIMNQILEGMRSVPVTLPFSADSLVGHVPALSAMGGAGTQSGGNTYVFNVNVSGNTMLGNDRGVAIELARILKPELDGLVSMSG